MTFAAGWRPTLVLAALGAALVLLAASADPASAGRLLATGHDVDDHCDTTTSVIPDDIFKDLFLEGQCGYMKVATDYVRGGAPDPSKPVLLLQCENTDGDNELLDALDAAYGTGVVPRTVICPSDPGDGWATLVLNTDNFSAMITGTSCNPSDDSLNLTDECDEAGADPSVAIPDTVAINARKADIEAFFNQGGGIFAMSGQDNGDGDPSTGPDGYYDFLPLPAEGLEVDPPFCLTSEGLALGFHDPLVDYVGDEGTCDDLSKRTGDRNDINCCETHNSFVEPPPGSLLKVAERQADGFPETLFAEGFIVGGELVASLPQPQQQAQQPAAAPAPAAAAPAARPRRPRVRVAGVRSRCSWARRKRVRVNVRTAAAARVRRVTLSLNRRRVKSTRRSRFSVLINMRRLSPGRRYRLRVLATDSAGNRSGRVRGLTRCARVRRAVPRFTG